MHWLKDWIFTACRYNPSRQAVCGSDIGGEALRAHSCIEQNVETNCSKPPGFLAFMSIGVVEDRQTPRIDGLCSPSPKQPSPTRTICRWCRASPLNFNSLPKCPTPFQHIPHQPQSLLIVLRISKDTWRAPIPQSSPQTASLKRQRTRSLV